MDVPDGASGLHLHCEHCVKLSRCAQAPAVSGERCDLINCPTGCGHRLHGCKLSEHQQLCPEQRVPCINSEYGCGLVMARRLRAAHLTSCPASVVLCMADWNRWPLLTPAPAPPAPAVNHESTSPHLGPLDSALLERDQRLLRDCLVPARSLARRLRVFPAVPLRLPGTYDCSHLAPELQLDREAAAAEQRPTDPPGLQRSVCSQLARTTLATSPAGDLNSNRTSPEPEPAVDLYAEKVCVHHIGRDMCKLCRHDPLPARHVVRRTWQVESGPAEPGGALCWRRLEVTEPARERPGKYDLDAALRRKRQLAAEQAAERRRAEQQEGADGPPLALTIDAIAVPEQSRPRALYTFQCARPLRRDEFCEHYRRLHGDVHGGAGSWIQQRCPMSQYGCGHFANRLYPDGPEHRFTVSPVSGCVGVTDVSVRPGPDPADPDPDPDPELGRNPGSEQDPELSQDAEWAPEWAPESALERGQDAEWAPESALERGRWFEQLPFEVLQHIASRLDPYSLNHLSLTCRLLRDVCASLLDSRGLVLLLWRRMPYDGGVTWRPVAQSWRFSCAFGPLRRLWFGGGAHMTDHLPRCAFYEPGRAAAPFSLLSLEGAGAAAASDEELERRLEKVRAGRHRRTPPS